MMTHPIVASFIYGEKKWNAPENLVSPEELDEGFRRAWIHTYSMKSILHRLSPKRNQFVVALAGNLAYRLYRARLKKDVHRWALGPEDVP